MRGFLKNVPKYLDDTINKMAMVISDIVFLGYFFTLLICFFRIKVL
jgi:hypothetical protein